MIKAIIFDFGRVLLLPKDKNYSGKLNPLYEEKKNQADFRFFDYFQLNEELLKLIEFNLKGKFGLYVFTTGSIQDAPEVKSRVRSIFSRVFSTAQTGLKKDEPQAYDLIVREVNLTYNEALFIDDSDENLEAARAAGLRTLKYESNDKLINDLKALSL